MEYYKNEKLNERIKNAKIKEKYGIKSLEYLIVKLDGDIISLFTRKENGELVDLPIRNKELQKKRYEKALEDLKEQFKKEPKKNKKIKGSKEKIEIIDWNLNSRNLMINLFFNVLKEKHRTAKDKLPSIDADALSKMKNSIAGELIAFRSNTKTLQSLKNVDSYIYAPEVYFDKNIPYDKANINYNILGYDNIERIFPVAGKSVPINADKRARLAFVVSHWDKVSENDLSKDVKNILNQVKE